MSDRVSAKHSCVAVTGATVLFGVVLCSGARCSADEQERNAITKGLKHVSTAGEKWINDRGCVSCHQVTSLLWSHTSAAGYGDAEDPNKIAHWIDWSTQVRNFVKPESKENIDSHGTMNANVDTMARLLLAVPPGSNRKDDGTWRGTFAKHLANLQQDNGSWQACGQLPLQKRPEEETQAATTLWTALALEQEQTEYNRKLALTFVDKVKDPVSTECIAARLLLADARGNQEVAKRICGQLLDKQNDDGGWGWLHAEQSDALGTGYALYAIKRVGCAEDKAIARATAHLIATQEDDGRWRVPGTKRSAKGRATATANDWGTAWAVVALATQIKQADNIPSPH